MPRTALSMTAWTSLLTTTVDTLIGVEGGDARFYTASTSGIPFEDGHLVTAGSSVIFPSGLAVSAVAMSEGVATTEINFGV